MGVTPSEKNTTAVPAHQARGRRRLFSTAMLVLLTLIWGLSFPVMKAAFDSHTDPIHFLALRFLSGFLVLTLVYLLRGRFPGGTAGKDAASAPTHAGSDAALAELLVEETPDGMHAFWTRLRTRRLRSPWLRGAVVGLFLFAGFSLQLIGLNYTTASRSGFFTGLLVVMVPPIALLLRTSRSPWLSWIALLPALAGVYLLADPQIGGLNLGDHLTLLCALAFALQMVVLEALAGPASDAEVLSYAQIGVVALFAVVWSLVEGHPFTIGLTGILAVAYTSLFGTVIAVWMQTRFQPEVPAGHAALIFQLEPVFAATFAWILLGDLWTSRGLFGAGLILAAMTLSSLAINQGERKRKRAAVPE